MRLVTRDELMKVPQGTPFFEYFPNNPHSITLMRFDGACDGDFLESTIGPHFVQEGYSKDIPKQHVSIDTHNGREGSFDDNALYVVLDPVDVETLVTQLRGEGVKPQTLVL
jgi:hypothetical protein